jgi:hypothetical protein
MNEARDSELCVTSAKRGAIDSQTETIEESYVTRKCEWKIVWHVIV